MVVFAKNREADKDLIIYCLWLLEVPFVSFQSVSNLLNVYMPHLPSSALYHNFLKDPSDIGVCAIGILC